MTTIRTDDLHRHVGRDTKRVQHVLVPYKNSVGGTSLRSRCEQWQWDTLDIVKGTPNCVRCMVR